MNNIYEQLRSDLKQARLARDTVATEILSYVVGTLMASAKLVDEVKVVSNQDAIAWIRKYISAIADVIELKTSEAQIARDRAEIAFLERYLPVELTADQLREILDTYVFSSIKEFMQFLKENYAGRYSGKLASDIWKEEVF